MADDREAQIRTRHVTTGGADVGFLLGRLDAARQRERRFREALEQIATCQSIVPGDVVDVAQKALGWAPTDGVLLLGHAPSCDCNDCAGAKGAT